MRIFKTDPKAIALVVAAGLAAMVPDIAHAQTKIYPSGKDCANLATIAERLLCGRQELRRQQGISTEQPDAVPPGSVPGSVDEPEPFATPPAAPSDLRPVPDQQMEMQQRTASPTH